MCTAINATVEELKGKGVDLGLHERRHPPPPTAS
jgi:hypothetical protein